MSLQGRPQGKTYQDVRRQSAELFPQGASLLDIVKNRPSSLYSLAGKEFRIAFSTHPDVMKLQGLTGEELIQQSINLRSVVENEEPIIKTKFRKALEQLMVENKVEDPLRMDVISRLSQWTKIQNDRRYRAKKKKEDPLGHKQQRVKYNITRREKQKQRQAMYGKKITPFEAYMKTLNLPKTITAAKIENYARDFVIESSRYTTGQLKKYLGERYNEMDVRNAMSNRSYHLGRLTNARDYEANGARRYPKAGVLNKRKSKSGGQRAASAASSGMHQEASSSSHAADEPMILQSIPTDQHVDPMDKQFHPTEWWNDWYNS